MVTVTSTELKNDLSHYIDLARTEDVMVTRNGKPVARISNPNEDRRAIAKALIGIIPDDGTTPEEARAERLSRI